jgi:hypothetical protein
MHRSVKIGIIWLLIGWILTLSTGLPVSGQLVSGEPDPLRGRIIDKKTRRPLAFVNITYLASGQGTVSNIDGAFSIASSQDMDFLKFSYVGYHPRLIEKEDLRPGKTLLIELEQKAYDIAEVKILPGINPAHRIIHLASDNRKLNNPEKHRSFSYTTYSKMYFTMDIDSMFRVGTDSLGNDRDSSRQDLGKFLEKQHLFLMEFVSERKFKPPDKNKEVVTASRVSGFRDPSFTLLASQIQSTSFYDELIMIWDKKYLNPISNGSTRKYLFILEDTVYTEQMDSLFVISYRQLKGRNFDGLKGILHINSRGYAIENVIAEAEETEGIFRIRIQQKYDYIDDQQWFPAQLNTDIILSPKNTEANGKPVKLLGIGKSYLSDIKLDPEFKNREFDHIELDVDDAAHKQDEHYWSQYRVNPLTRKDSNTYHFIDSVGKEAHLDRTLKIFETFAAGYIPIGFLNLDYRSLIHWNQYEGFRFGAAAETNEKIAWWFSIGGKVAYGTRDKRLKYGGHLKFNLNYRKDAWLKFKYDNDVVETAGFRFLDKPPITSSEIFRSFLIAQKDIMEEKALELQFPALRYVKINTYFSQATRQVTSDYRYVVSTPEGELETDRFPITETGVLLRYAHKEKFLETPRGNRLSLGTSYPVLYANIHVGLPVLGGEYEYTKVEAKITKTFVSKSLGDTKIAMAGGWTDRILPYPLLYAGIGSYATFTIETENSFATMRLNEFVSNRFANLYFQQDFGKLLFRRGQFQPGIVLATNVGFGQLSYDPNHVNLEQESYEKGYYESGILFNNLLRHLFIGYGLGVFYRYGPYLLPKTIDNFAFKFTIRFNL